jgi:hypothetical protein
MATAFAQRGHEVTLFTVSREHKFHTVWSIEKGVHLCEFPNFGQENSGEGYGPLDSVHPETPCFGAISPISIRATPR